MEIQAGDEGWDAGGGRRHDRSEFSPGRSLHLAANAGQLYDSSRRYQANVIEAPYPADLGSNLNDSVAVQFDVDDNGIPINLRAQSPSGPKLETEALAIVSGWRFRPGMKDGKPISVPSAFDFAHGTSGTSGTQVLRVGGNVQAANLIRKITPVYPVDAKANGIQGVVRLGVRIDKDGHVSDVTVLSGDPTLTYVAVEAVKQWLYRPTLLNGSPVEVLTEVDVNFTLLQ